MTLGQCFGRRPAQCNRGKSQTSPQRKNFQKYIRCRVILDKNRKVELFEVTLLFEVIPFDGVAWSLIEYNMRNVFIKKSYKKYSG